MQVPRYHDEPMWWVLKTLGEVVALKEPGQHIRFQVVNPDLGVSLYPGELWSEDGVSLRYRSLADWVEVAEVLGCRMHTPRTLEHPWVEMTFTRLDQHHYWHQDSLPSGNPEKYGSQTEYGRWSPLSSEHPMNTINTAIVVDKRFIIIS